LKVIRNDRFALDVMKEALYVFIRPQRRSQVQRGEPEKQLGALPSRQQRPKLQSSILSSTMTSTCLRSFPTSLLLLQQPDFSWTLMLASQRMMVPHSHNLSFTD
jgi:hypothetical protein